MLFDVPGMELTKLQTAKWLADDRAVLLELSYTYHDSIDFPGELALLYDFERGQLHSFGGASAWFVWPPEYRESRKLDRKKFDDAVAEVSRRPPTTPPAQSP